MIFFVQLFENDLFTFFWQSFLEIIANIIFKTFVKRISLQSITYIAKKFFLVLSFVYGFSYNIFNSFNWHIINSTYLKYTVWYLLTFLHTIGHHHGQDHEHVSPISLWPLEASLPPFSTPPHLLSCFLSLPVGRHCLEFSKYGIMPMYCLPSSSLIQHTYLVFVYCFILW